MAEAKLRIRQKHDTEANWLKATTFVPLDGELIIYDIDDLHSTPRFKVGDGTKTVGNLPFLIAPADNAISPLYNYLHNIRAYRKGTYNPEGSHYISLYALSKDKTPVTNSDGILALLGDTFKYFPSGAVEDDEEIYKVDYITQDGLFYTVGSTLKVSPWSYLTVVSDAVQDYSGVWNNIGDVKLAGNNTFTGTNKFTNNTLEVDGDDGKAVVFSAESMKIYPDATGFNYTVKYPKGYTSTGDIPSIATTLDIDNCVKLTGDQIVDGSKFFTSKLRTPNGIETTFIYAWSDNNAIDVPNKRGTLFLKEDLNNFTLLISKPSDWNTNYSNYYTKNSDGWFVCNYDDTTWAANKFYSVTPAEFDVQTLNNKIKLQSFNSTVWGQCGGLELSATDGVKLYHSSNELGSSSVGVLKIQDEQFDVTAENATIQLKSGYTNIPLSFAVKDNSSTYFETGLNTLPTGEITSATYCNINAPLNVTNIHGFKQLTSQPSDWSANYDSYYDGFASFNTNATFFGRNIPLYKPTNDIALNVGQDHKISLDYVGKEGGSITVNYGLDVSTNGITVRGPISTAAGYKLELPSSAGTLAHIPTGTSQNAMMFGNGTWKEPITINENTFKSMANKSIYAPTGKGILLDTTYEYTNHGRSYCVMRYGDTEPMFVDPLFDTYSRQVFTHVAITNATATTWQIAADIRVCRTVTIGVKHSKGNLVTLTLTPSMINVSSNNILNTDIVGYGEGSTFHVKVTSIDKVTGGKIATTFSITNNSYNNLKGMWYIWLDY